jgi:hypothetical protein
MKTLACFLLVIVLQNVPLTIVGNEPFDLSKKLALEEGINDPIPSSLNVRIFQGFGYRHVGWDLDVAYQFKKYFSVGIGIAAHFNKTSFYSASDEHNLNMWSMPLFAYTNIFLINRERGSLYIHGKFGRSYGIKTESVTPDKDFDAIMLDAGLGYQITNTRTRRHIYFEIGQHYVTAKGTLISSYNSIIQYSDMEILNITGRIGFKF